MPSTEFILREMKRKLRALRERPNLWEQKEKKRVKKVNKRIWVLEKKAEANEKEIEELQRKVMN